GGHKRSRTPKTGPERRAKIVHAETAYPWPMSSGGDARRTAEHPRAATAVLSRRIACGARRSRAACARDRKLAQSTPCMERLIQREATHSKRPHAIVAIPMTPK